ncbi:sporulation histidine kinase inhibitor Sda [Robertmurraya korlensis]|uniref:sporulation histidine kinase inhibitor Sda n=1 Tax=Robertmurraya korlensis TaxID=519977 RepID=UPI0009FEC9C2
MEVFSINTSLGILSDTELVTVYSKALIYKLDIRFVELILQELNRRGLKEAS